MRVQETAPPEEGWRGLQVSDGERIVLYVRRRDDLPTDMLVEALRTLADAAAGETANMPMPRKMVVRRWLRRIGHPRT